MFSHTKTSLGDGFKPYYAGGGSFDTVAQMWLRMKSRYQ